MDCGSDYIKMCEKAKEIQKLWNPTDGDFCWHDNGGDDYLGSWEFPATTAVVHMAVGNSKNYWHSWLWLPTQDQLQAMVVVGSHPLPIANLGWRFQTFFNEQYSELNQATPTAVFPSFEQLWLAFVCKELYQKSWDGSDWIES